MTIQELINVLSVYPSDMEVVVEYNDPGFDEPLILPIVSSNIDEDTFWDYDENRVSNESLIIKIN